ncbi:hypothetical protein PPERSA_02084 [Pseudocohnilembus persalinus]|uniref:Uncharacterized protein n=1 Tax=Pseudocohnilembus persalinus TaxID=266149 RepID=A0A0V0Q7S8_PSEPJ|nr:hypothetical protein PPERSA_02084 [Pseudocohnilembus persalinus]|eukprot:KRW98307.1 hypothetical protein PPERSA_02084 [Pseudocohnilembus persalinus]
MKLMGKQDYKSMLNQALKEDDVINIAEKQEIKLDIFKSNNEIMDKIKIKPKKSIMKSSQIPSNLNEQNQLIELSLNQSQSQSEFDEYKSLNQNQNLISQNSERTLSITQDNSPENSFILSSRDYDSTNLIQNENQENQNEKKFNNLRESIIVTKQRQQYQKSDKNQHGIEQNQLEENQKDYTKNMKKGDNFKYNEIECDQQQLCQHENGHLSDYQIKIQDKPLEIQNKKNELNQIEMVYNMKKNDNQEENTQIQIKDQENDESNEFQIIKGQNAERQPQLQKYGKQEKQLQVVKNNIQRQKNIQFAILNLNENHIYLKNNEQVKQKRGDELLYDMYLRKMCYVNKQDQNNQLCKWILPNSLGGKYAIRELKINPENPISIQIKCYFKLKLLNPNIEDKTQDSVKNINTQPIKRKQPTNILFLFFK